MWRAGLAGLLAVLVLAAPARAATPTVTTPWGSATPSFVSSLTQPKAGDGPTLIGDGWGLNPPTLHAAPGADVTVTVDAPVDAIAAGFVGTPLPAVPAGNHAFTVTLPADTALPGEFWVRLTWSTETTVTSASWRMNLDAVPVAPPPPPEPPVVTQPEPPAAALAARVRGRRLAVLVVCPAAARSGCSGVLTLRTTSVRVARLPFRLAGGTQRTLRTTLSRRVAKHLGRELRSELVSPGRPAVRARLVVR